jgi:hypothetical protein
MSALERIRRSTGLLLVFGVVTALTSCSSSTSTPNASSRPSQSSTEAQRVAQAFATISTAAEKRDGRKSVWSKPVVAARTSLPNGDQTAMWVAGNVALDTSHGYYLDFTSEKSKTAKGVPFWGSITTEEISLDRALGSFVVGTIGHAWGASSVRVTAHGVSVDLPVTKDFFLVPGYLATDPASKLTITLLDDWGKPFGSVSGLMASGIGKPTASTSAIPIPDSSLHSFPAVRNWPVRTVSAGVRAASTAYFKAQNLLPITIYKNSENVLNLADQRSGFHWFNSGDGIIGGYEGQVPPRATAAVMVYVYHPPSTDGTGVTSSFLTVANMPGKGWQVVGENTAP